MTSATRADESAFIAEALRAEGAAIERAAALAEEGLAERWGAALDLLAEVTGHVVVSGMGKSGLVGAKISATFSSLGQPSSLLHPSEAMHGDLGRVRRGDVVLLLSYSGTTQEVVDLALILRADGLPTLGLSKADGTPLAEACTRHLPLGDVTEACPLNLAPTASTTVQLAVGDALALALARRRAFTADDFHRSHPGGMLGVGLRRVMDVLRLRVGDGLPALPASMPLREALLAARPASREARRAGAILLVDEAGALAGIFTDGDLRRLVLDDPAALDRPVREVMTPRPKRLGTDALVRDAERLVREHRVDEIPVVDDAGRPIGLLDVQDLVTLKIVRES